MASEAAPSRKGRSAGTGREGTAGLIGSSSPQNQQVSKPALTGESQCGQRIVSNTSPQNQHWTESARIGLAQQGQSLALARGGMTAQSK
jgi:hypothetical protein